MALFVVLALRISLLSDLGDRMIWGLLLGQSLSRAASTMQLAIFPYVQHANSTSKSKDVAVSGRVQFTAALLWTGTILAVSTQLGLSLAAVSAIAITMISLILLLGWRFMKRAGGLTGDFLGTTQQLTELGILIMLVSL